MSKLGRIGTSIGIPRTTCSQNHWRISQCPWIAAAAYFFLFQFTCPLQYFEMTKFGGVRTSWQSTDILDHGTHCNTSKRPVCPAPAHKTSDDPKHNLEHGPIVAIPTDQTMIPHNDRSVHPIHSVRLNVNICRTGRKSPYQRPTTHGRISHVLYHIRRRCGFFSFSNTHTTKKTTTETTTILTHRRRSSTAAAAAAV
jgi:hypothetical protein